MRILFFLLVIFLIQIPFEANARPKPENVESSEVADAFINFNYYENGHGILFAMPPAINTLAEWFIERPGNPTSELYPLKFTRGPIATILNIGNVVEERFGLTVVDRQVLGIFKTRYHQQQIYVAGCAACHSGKAAGHYYIGLGNKNIDPEAMGSASKIVLDLWKKSGVPESAKSVYENSRIFSDLAANSAISNQTRGLVPTAMIKSWVYRELNLPFPFMGLKRGLVKAPHLWGIDQKRRTGFFADGAGNGETAAWMFGAESMISGKNAEHYDANQAKTMAALELTKKILPPRYPFSIDAKRAQQGKVIFQKTCIECHQAHERDSKGNPLYIAPLKIDLAVIKTDPARALSVDQDFFEKYEKTAWKRVLPFHAVRPGYIAPSLWGIWARFPYLHNASVLSVYEMMIPPAKRAQKFSLRDAGEASRFDSKKLGLSSLSIAGEKNPKFIHDTSRDEQSNQGHYFKFMAEFSDEDRYAVVEYLKTL